VAAGIHGALRTTLDSDVAYSRRPENIARLVAALVPCRPYLPGAPLGLPFRLDSETMHRGLNFTLTTTLGDLDLLGEVTGGGLYEALAPTADVVELEGFQCLLVSLPRLIAPSARLDAARTAKHSPNWRRCSKNARGLRAVGGPLLPGHTAAI
jgi:hypothetical protein